MTTEGQVERMLAIQREWERAHAEDDEFRIENVAAGTGHAPAVGSESIFGGLDERENPYSILPPGSTGTEADS